MPASVKAIQSYFALATPTLRPFPGVASSTRTTRPNPDKEGIFIHSSTISGVPSSDPPSTTITSFGPHVCPPTLDITHSTESAPSLTGKTSETFTPPSPESWDGLKYVPRFQRAGAHSLSQETCCNAA